MKKILFIPIFLFLFTLLQAKTIHIMPLGDSLTYDDSYADYDGYSRPASLRHAYRNYLYYKLYNANFNIDFVGSRVAGSDITPHFDPDNEGYPGKTTDYIASIIYNKLVQNPTDIILLHIGTNDRWRIDQSGEYMGGIHDIFNEIDRYERNYNHHVKVVLALIIGRRNHDFSSFTNTFNSNLKNLANNRIVDGDDITIVDMQHNAGINYHNDFRDPAHPTLIGYEKMANLWFNSLNQILPEMYPQNPLIKPFVERFYTNILLREGDEEGVTYWTNSLTRGNLVASDLARSFIFSEEFQNQNVDNTTFLERLYHAFFDRIPDNEGFIYWENKLNTGTTRFNVLNGFLHSIEFKNLSESYNIIPVNQAEFLVKRLYTKALERDPDKNGFIYWVYHLTHQNLTASQVVSLFFFSQEFINKNTDDETYINILYQTLLGREKDIEGFEYWLNKLNQGESRLKLLKYFIYSSEFKNLVETYHIAL